MPALEYRPLLHYLQEIVANPVMQKASVGVKVESVTTGKTLFTHHADQLINPASVTKIYTTAAALCLLHPNFRFKTEIYAHRRPTNGLIRGPIYLKGYGDPFLVNERLAYLTTELRSFGLRRVDGPLVIDDTYFDEVAQGPGWKQDDSTRPYMAPMSALSLNFNTTMVLVLPSKRVGQKARIQLIPDTDHAIIENHVITKSYGTRIRIQVEGLGTQTKIILHGKISFRHSGHRYYCRISSPAWYTGRALRSALVNAGIKMPKTIRKGETPRFADKYYVSHSPPLGELIRKVNKNSQNFMAEQLFKVLGAELLGAPGSWYKGQQVMNAFLEKEVGIEDSTYILHNGSGLNDVNRVTADQTVKLLRYMWRRPDVQPDFVASLAVSGADGTVSKRFRHPALLRTMRLKTGSLDQVRTLAGYIYTQGGEVLAFCIMVARYQCSDSQIIELINRFAAALAQADADHMLVNQIEVLPLDHLYDEEQRQNGDQPDQD